MAKLGAVQQKDHVVIPEEDVATSLDLAGMATLLPAPKGPGKLTVYGIPEIML